MSRTDARRTTYSRSAALLVLIMGALASGTPAAVAQTGCGGLLQPACPPAPAPAPTPAPTPPPAPAPPMDPAAYAAIEPVFALGARASREASGAADTRRYAAACRAMPQGPPPVDAYRASCRADVVALQRAERDCETPRGCARVGLAIADAGRTAVRALRGLNRALATSVPDRACRATLRTSAAELRYVERLLARIRNLARALRSEDPRRIRAANAALSRLREPTGTLTPGQRLRAFRADCR